MIKNNIKIYKGNIVSLILLVFNVISGFIIGNNLDSLLNVNYNTYLPHITALLFFQISLILLLRKEQKMCQKNKNIWVSQEETLFTLIGLIFILLKISLYLKFINFISI